VSVVGTKEGVGEGKTKIWSESVSELYLVVLLTLFKSSSELGSICFVLELMELLAGLGYRVRNS